MKPISNPIKLLSSAKQRITDEIEGGLLEPVAAERLLDISKDIEDIAIHVFAKEIKDSIPYKVRAITWSGWHGEDEMGMPGSYVDNVELVFMVAGMPYGLPVRRDFYDFDSAPLILISYLADIQVANIEDAEKALSLLNDTESPPFSINPDSIEKFCHLSFANSGIEEWPFPK